MFYRWGINLIILMSAIDVSHLVTKTINHGLIVSGNVYQGQKNSYGGPSSENTSIITSNQTIFSQLLNSNVATIELHIGSSQSHPTV